MVEALISEMQEKKHEAIHYTISHIPCMAVLDDDNGSNREHNDEAR